MKVWLDDERPMPAGFDTHVKTAYACIELLKTGKVEMISLDHDLGIGFEGNDGYEVAKFIERGAVMKTLPEIKTMLVHTQNPVGRRNMIWSLSNARKIWDSHKESECSGIVG